MSHVSSQSCLIHLQSSGKAKRLDKTTHDQLLEIFKKVGLKENTKEGLRELYEFKKRHPEANMEPYLQKTSQYFQNYLERGLAALEAEEKQGSTAGFQHTQFSLSS